jgi:hypothetical protein
LKRGSFPIGCALEIHWANEAADSSRNILGNSDGFYAHLYRASSLVRNHLNLKLGIL